MYETQREIDFVDLSLANALSLANLLRQNRNGVELSDVYVQDKDGNVFTGAKLIEKTLTDGSKVYNLVLLA